jgi:hypothetical protein
MTILKIHMRGRWHKIHIKNLQKIQKRTFRNERDSEELSDNERLLRTRDRFNNANREVADCETRIAEYRAQHPGMPIPSILRDDLASAQEELEDATLQLDYESVYGSYGSEVFSSPEDNNSNDNDNDNDNDNEDDNQDEEQNEEQDQNINTDNSKEISGTKRSRSDSTDGSEGPKGPKRPRGPEDPNGNDGTGNSSTGPSNTDVGGGTTKFIYDMDDTFINLHEIYLVLYNLNTVPLFILVLFVRTSLFFYSSQGRYCLFIMYVNLLSCKIKNNY